MTQTLASQVTGSIPEPSARRENNADRSGLSTDGSAHAAEESSIPALMASSAGEWLDASQIHQWAMQQLGLSPDKGGQSENARRCDLAVDLAGLDYLEAGALQVLLAIHAEQTRRGQHLRLLNPSPSLCEWFNYAGSANLLEAECNPASAKA